jgi:hypothetical protein
MIHGCTVALGSCIDRTESALLPLLELVTPTLYHTHLVCFMFSLFPRNRKPWNQTKPSQCGVWGVGGAYVCKGESCTAVKLCHPCQRFAWLLGAFGFLH